MSNQSNYPTLSQERFQNTYKFINGAGTYKVKCLRVSPEVASVSQINPGGTTRIVNLNVIFPHHVDGIKEAFKDGEARYEDLNGLTATYNVESNSSDEIPGKGEEVRIVVEEYTPTTERALNKGKTILVVTSMRPAQAVVARSVSAIFGNTQEEETPELTEEAEREMEEALASGEAI